MSVTEILFLLVENKIGRGDQILLKAHRLSNRLKAILNRFRNKTEYLQNPSYRGNHP